MPRKSTRGKRPPARPAFGTATAALGPATPSGGTVTSGGELGAARWGKWPPAVSLAGGELSVPGQPRNPRLPPSGRPRALARPGRAGVDLAPSRSNQRAGGRAPRLRVPAGIAAPRRLLPAVARLSLLPVLRLAAGGAPEHCHGQCLSPLRAGAEEFCAPDPTESRSLERLGSWKDLGLGCLCASCDDSLLPTFQGALKRSRFLWCSLPNIKSQKCWDRSDGAEVERLSALLALT